ncbi:hypothetical protein GVAV_002652 [Gurleya vavrai]
MLIILECYNSNITRVVAKKIVTGKNTTNGFQKANSSEKRSLNNCDKMTSEIKHFIDNIDNKNKRSK